MKTTHDRFLEKIKDQGKGCWEWIGAINPTGYGSFYFEQDGVKRSNSPHRYAHQHYIGPIPAGYHVDHLCRNRKCVNPSHLEAVTPKENALRGISPAAINARKSVCINGHKLTGRNVQGRYCLTCNREFVYRDRRENPQKTKEKQAIFRKTHKEHIKEYNKSYWKKTASDPEKLRIYNIGNAERSRMFRARQRAKKLSLLTQQHG